MTVVVALVESKTVYFFAKSTFPLFLYYAINHLGFIYFFRYVKMKNIKVKMDKTNMMETVVTSAMIYGYNSE
jgi:hypothetical protein